MEDLHSDGRWHNGERELRAVELKILEVMAKRLKDYGFVLVQGRTSPADDAKQPTGKSSPLSFKTSWWDLSVFHLPC